MRISLTQKIFAGNFLLLAVVISMIIILIHEHRRMREIDAEMHNLQSLRSGINIAQLNITELAIMGENVLSWENSDLTYYHKKRLSTDSLLQILSPQCRDYIRPGQIDTLRQLLNEKEMLLSRVMEAINQQRMTDSLLINHLPEVAKRATRIRTIKQKRQNLLGVLGSKKKVQILPSAKELHLFSDSLIALQQEGTEEMETHADNLRIQNLSLNSKLKLLIKDLEKQIRVTFAKREQKIVAAQDLSIRLYSVTLFVSIILLIIFHIAIYREIRHKIKVKKKREKLIGELQESEEKNKRLIRLQRNLIQNITHELRIPLTVIRGNAELLLNDTEADNRMHHVQTIHNAAGRMAGMINSLLEYFRLDSGKETPSVKPFKLCSIAEILKTEFEPLAERKQLSFMVENQADEIASGDKDRILSIGSNLLSNAIKFTSNGTITLVTECKESTFVLTVEDTGTGMTEEQQQRIFIPFERLGNAVTEDGFGLGLAIVADTVKLLQGTVRVESKPGKGSRFTVCLPLPKAEETVRGEKTSMRHSMLSGSYVLAIDNNGMLLDMMKEMYKQSGVECDTCLTVGELTDLMRTKDYDLLITDLKMPEVNGYEILELLRTSEVGNSQTIPIVAATAAGYVTEDELKGKGFASVLYKPYSINELLAVTESCTKQKQPDRIDLSPLLTFGDKRRTLEKLATTTQTDMDGVCKAAEAKDKEALDGWVHHLRSSWMLIKAERPLVPLYDAIHKESITNEELNIAVDAVLAQGSLIIDLARKEAERWAE